MFCKLLLMKVTMLENRFARPWIRGSKIGTASRRREMNLSQAFWTISTTFERGGSWADSEEIAPEIPPEDFGSNPLNRWLIASATVWNNAAGLEMAAAKPPKKALRRSPFLTRLSI